LFGCLMVVVAGGGDTNEASDSSLSGAALSDGGVRGRLHRRRV